MTNRLNRLVCAAALAIAGGCGSSVASPVGVGMTSEVRDVLLPGSELRPTPDSSGRSPVVVRITGVYPHGTAGFRYDMNWSALEPGTHDLTKYLERVDGTPIGELPPVLVEAAAVLAPGPPGHLGGFSAPEPKVGGYRVALITAGVLWVAGLVWLVFWRRGKPAAAVEVAEEAVPLSERLRPLLEQARAGALGADDRARLERLLLGFWRERLGLTGLPVPLAIERLRAHAEAGALLRKVEEWLHSGKPSAGEGTVVALLGPYLDRPAPAASPTPAA